MKPPNFDLDDNFSKFIIKDPQTCIIIPKEKKDAEEKNSTDKNYEKKPKSIIPKSKSKQIKVLESKKCNIITEGKKDTENKVIKQQTNAHDESKKISVEFMKPFNENEIHDDDLTEYFIYCEQKIKIDIALYQNKLNELPKKCKDLEEYYDILNEYFSILESKMNSLDTSNKDEPLMKNWIKLKYNDYIKSTKLKISDLLTESYYNKIVEYTKQHNANNLSILEDSIPYDILIKEKLKEILNGLDLVINEIYDYVHNRICNLFYESFGRELKYLRLKVIELFDKYGMEQMNKVKFYFEETIELVTTYVLTNDNDLLIKNNYINKDINHYILNLKNEQNNNNNDNDIVKKGEYTINFVKTIISFGLGKKVVDFFDNASKNVNILMESIRNYNIERHTQYIENNEYMGRINIGYTLKGISSFTEKIINPDYKRYYKKEEDFIPGYQYIDKEKLDCFKELIKNGKISLKIANGITKMVAYLEIILNKILDLIYLSIYSHLYDQLINQTMMNNIKNELYKLGKSNEWKDLMELPVEITRKKEELTKKLVSLNRKKNVIKILKYKTKNN